jgi:hypothetical protein
LGSAAQLIESCKHVFARCRVAHDLQLRNIMLRI